MRQRVTTESALAEAREAGVVLTQLRGLKAALGLLFPIPMRNPDDAATWARAPAWVVPLGLAVGLCWIGVFRAAWKYYGERANMLIVPALSITLLEGLLTGPFLILGLARTIHLLTSRRPRQSVGNLDDPLSPAGTLVLCLAVLSQWVLIASIPVEAGWWPPPGDWRYRFRFLYAAPLYRPLLLAPLWGRWGILLAATIGRTAKTADPAMVAFCRSMHPSRLLFHAILPLGITSVYFSRDRNLVMGLIVGLLVFAVTYLVSFAMARRGGGQTSQSLFASGQIGQLAFLGLYRAFWPLIHG